MSPITLKYIIRTYLRNLDRIIVIATNGII